MRVLVVEDEPVMAEAIKKALVREGIAVDIVSRGYEALEILERSHCDVVLLDRDLPDLSGDEVCVALSQASHRPGILMVTAARRLDDTVRGLELGADDYLTKPVQLPELVARVRALARRPREAVPAVLESGGVRVHVDRREVYRNDRYIRLSPKEFAVLLELMRAGGAVMSSEDLLERAWDENADVFTNSPRVTVSTLRKKLGLPSPIVTLPGFGYAFRGES